jgi:hypothetical protein
MRALAHLSACVMEHHMIYFTVAMDLDLCPTVFLIPKRKTDVLEACGKTSTTNDAFALS